MNRSPKVKVELTFGWGREDQFEAPHGFEMFTKLVPRRSWDGCDKCWKDGVSHNGPQAVFGGPCYIRFAYCDHREEAGMRLRPERRSKFIGVKKDKLGRWIWVGYRKAR